MTRHRYLLVLVGLLIFASLACNAFSGEPLEPGLALPDAPGSGDTDVDDGDVAQLPTAVIQNLAPTATIEGELTVAPPTAVAEPIDGDALLTALVDVNIRLGPGVAYARDSFVLKGETAVVLGRHSESGWWKIVCPERADGNVCWVSGGSQYTKVSNAGAAESVAAPPTSTPEPTVEATAVSDSSASSSMIEDSTETELLSDAAMSSLAADGARMVYADAGALWLLLLGEDGAAEPIWLADAENVTDLLISPNGRYVAYVTTENSDSTLNLVELDTGVQQVLVFPADLAEMAPSADETALIEQVQWLADSQSLAFNTYPMLVGGGMGGFNQQDLWTVDLSGALTERFPAGEGGGSFAISPENVVLFGQETAVVRTNLDGSNYETLIEFDFVNTASEFAFYPWLQWLDSGSSANVAISSAEPYSSATAELWFVPASGEVGTMAPIEGNIIFSPVIWSGAGRQLGYVLENGRTDSALVIGMGDGTGTRIYDNMPTRFFGWSPAESHFVYAGQGNYAVGQLGDDPLVIDIAEGRTAVSAQWLNDNAFIIALGSAENWDFRQQTTDGPATRLVSGSTTPLFDIWSP